jgi:hypothetical protein
MISFNNHTSKFFYRTPGPLLSSLAITPSLGSPQGGGAKSFISAIRPSFLWTATGHDDIDNEKQKQSGRSQEGGKTEIT